MSEVGCFYVYLVGNNFHFPCLEQMELKGTDLQKFIRDQKTHYRDMRAAEREREKEEKEFQLKRGIGDRETENAGRAR